MTRDDAILDYLQDRLAPEDRTSFEARMAQDPALAAEVSVMKSVRAELASGPMHEKADVVWDRLSQAMENAPEVANANRAPWRTALQYAAACTLAIAVWQFGVVPRLAGTDSGFRAASGQSEGAILQVRFVQSVTLAEISALLDPFGGTISDGPGALGIVRLTFPDAPSRDQALAALQDREDLVEFVAEQ